MVILRGERQRHARYHPTAVDQNGAGAALAVVASLLRASETNVFAKRIEHGGPRIDAERFVCAIDPESYIHWQ